MPTPARLTRRGRLIDDAARHPNADPYIIPVSIGYTPWAIALFVLVVSLAIGLITAPGLADSQTGRIVLAIVGALAAGAFTQFYLAPRILVGSDRLTVVRALMTYEIPWSDVERAECRDNGLFTNLWIRLERPRAGLTVDPTVIQWIGGNTPSVFAPEGRTRQLAELINDRRAMNRDRYPPATTSGVATHATRPAAISYCAAVAAAALLLTVALAT